MASARIFHTFFRSPGVDTSSAVRPSSSVTLPMLEQISRESNADGRGHDKRSFHRPTSVSASPSISLPRAQSPGAPVISMRANGAQPESEIDASGAHESASLPTSMSSEMFDDMRFEIAVSIAAALLFTSVADKDVSKLEEGAATLMAAEIAPSASEAP